MMGIERIEKNFDQSLLIRALRRGCTTPPASRTHRFVSLLIRGPDTMSRLMISIVTSSSPRFVRHRRPPTDYVGARALMSSLAEVDWLLRDPRCDADWFREALNDERIRACVHGRKQRKRPVKYDKRRYRIEIMFGRQGLEAWCNPLQQMPEGLPVSNRARCSRHLLAMCPDPKHLKPFAF